MRRKTLYVTLMMLSVFLMLLAPSMLFAGGQKEKGEIVLKWPCIWVAKDSKAPTVAALVDEFNKANEGKIKVVIEPNPDYDGYRNKINTAIASGQVPDLFVFNPDPTTFSYYEGDLLMDFTDDLKGAWGNEFVAGSIAGATRKGKTKSIPYEIAITPIWYNTTLFKKAGIASFPKTFDEFSKDADKLKAAGIVPTSQMTGGSNAWTSMLWYSHIMAALGGPDVWKRPLTDPIYVEGAKYLKFLYSNGNTTKDAVGADAGVSGGHYLAGQTAMFINGPWYIGRIRKDAPEVYKSTNLAPAPVPPGGQWGGQIGFPLSNLAAANTKDPARRAAVIKFLKWMTMPDNVKKISLDAGSLFAVKLSLTPNDKVDQLQAKFIAASKNAKFITTHFQANFPVSVVTEFGQALGAMALGKTTPEGFVKMLQDANK